MKFFRYMDEFNVDAEYSDYLKILMSYKIMGEACEESLKSKGFDQLMKYPEDFKFDLVIYDFTYLPCVLGILPKLNYPPVIGISAFSNPPTSPDIVGGDRLGLTVKPYFTQEYDHENMNMIQRLNNGFLNFWDSL